MVVVVDHLTIIPQKIAVLTQSLIRVMKAVAPVLILMTQQLIHVVLV